MPADRPGDHVVLFDIDGTLMRTGGAGGRALNEAWRDLFGEEDAFRDVSFVGSTDSLILDQVFEQWRGNVGTTAEREALLTRYLELLPGAISACGHVVNPGVNAALTALGRATGVAVGLATGNIEAAARI